MKKANQRMYQLGKLRDFNVCSDILEAVYRSLVESVLAFNIVCWFSNLTVKNKGRLARIVNQASKIIGRKQLSLDQLHYTAVRRKAGRIIADRTHPLNRQFKLLPSGRRFDVPLAKKNLFKFSFVPTAVSILNS